ncbi:MAG: pantetheine-phosphate adenylyltransferase [Dehalococcoidia bacterium]|nr:pantetheine-phosphate adenylyltransferase [Dehalococcoidia bacterium]
MILAIYPGTFDPVTYGHLDIISRASSLFDKLIVSVYADPKKDILFSLDQRVEMMSRSTSHLPNVVVQGYEGLTVSFMKTVGAKVMVRGLRVISDFEWEFQMALSNKKMAPELEMICLMTSAEYSFLSSSIVKQIAELGGSIKDMVPPHVEAALKEAFCLGQKAAAKSHRAGF